MSSFWLKKVSIPFFSLNQGVSTFTFQQTCPDLVVGEGCQFPDVLDIKANITRLEGDYLVELSVKSNGRLMCDRCGVEFQRVIKGEVKTLYSFNIRKVHEEASDTVYIPHSVEALDITQDVMDAFVLAIPSKCLCSEECLGLCPDCGTNLNIKRCSCSSHTDI